MIKVIVISTHALLAYLLGPPPPPWRPCPERDALVLQIFALPACCRLGETLPAIYCDSRLRRRRELIKRILNPFYTLRSSNIRSDKY
ncbi:hypothetical protein DFH27DRAFT_181050 [Peziza echinospora]|nr:hypothetical protein DFH27DRAFT_181050 [Peziza echinospora]